MSALSLSPWPYPGTRWWKFDFHTHTPVSTDTPWHSLIGKPDELTPEHWLQKYMDAGIDCVAVTDHNSGAWIDPLNAAYARMQQADTRSFRALRLFPGVELSVNGGFHLLAIFAPGTRTSDIDTLLGRVEYDGTKGDSDGVTRKSAVQVIEAVIAAGGLAIPAHAEADKGLLRLREGSATKATLDANSLQQVFGCGHVLAIEVLDRAQPKPAIYVEAKVRWSEILGSDCHNFRSPAGRGQLGSAYTWVRMAAPSLEGLRLALLDGANFSLRRSDDERAFDPFAQPEHFVETIAVHDARYMGGKGSPLTMAFSPWFNALIGGRGTGKSSIVHFLRLAYRRDSELTALDPSNEARQTFERFIHEPASRDEHGGIDLRSARKTKVVVTVMRDGVRHRLCWQQDGRGPVVQVQADGGWRDSPSQETTPARFPARLFSQGQIAALAGDSQQALLAVIDEAANAGPWNAAIEDAKRRFLTLRARVREVDGKLASQPQVAVQLDDVRRKLARFEEAHHAEVLKAYQLCARQDREMSRQIDAVSAVAGLVLQLAETVVPDDVPDGLFDVQRPQDREAAQLAARLAQAISDAAKALSTISANLGMAANAVRSALEVSAWRAAEVQAKADYDALVLALKAQGVADPSEYGKLVQERQRLETETARLGSLGKERLRLTQEAAAQRRALLMARRELSEARRSFLSNSLADNPYVRIELCPYGRDARVIERSVRRLLGVTDGRFEDDILVVADDQSMKGLVADFLATDLKQPRPTSLLIEARLDAFKLNAEEAHNGLGKLNFGGYFSNYLEREFKRQPEILDRVHTWFPEDSLQVEYSRKGDGKDFRPIDQASAGQRAAAMLAFLLAHGNEPIILDQPEDDLDNHLIYELVVRQIRGNKQRRQIIVITHNPNIVVNGDAEMLHAMDFQGGQCKVVQSGSLQERAMREEVCRVMEGGREAFESRYRRLSGDI